MKKSLKCLSVILVMLITLFSFSITALAQTTTQDGLQVNLTTDKQNYSLNEDIEITVSVTNTNDFTVEDVSIEALLPDKFELKDSKQEVTTKAIDLKAGENVTLKLTALVKGEEQTTEPTTNPTEPTKPVEPSTEPSTEPTTESTTNPTTNPTDNTKPSESTTQNSTTSTTEMTTKVNTPLNVKETTTNTNNKSQSTTEKTKAVNNNKNGKSPYTGVDYILLSIFFVIFFFSVSGLLYCLIVHTKKTKKAISSVLCFVIAVTSVIGFTSYKAYADDREFSTITISEHIKVDNKDYTVLANVKYNVKSIVYTLEADEQYFFVGDNAQILFTLKVENLNEEINLYNNKNKNAILMNDKGENGDEIAGDGIYSCFVNITYNNETTIVFHAENKSIKSNNFSVYFFDDFTDKDYSKSDEICKEIQKIEKKYADSDGYVSDENKDKAISKVFEYVSNLQTKGQVINCNLEYFNGKATGITIKLASGISIVYEPNQKNHLSSNKALTTSSIIIYQSALETFEKDVQDFTREHFNELYSNITTDYKNCTGKGYYENSQVTLSSLSDIKDNQIVLWLGHGLWSDNHTYLEMGETYNSSSTSKLKAKNWIIQTTNHKLAVNYQYLAQELNNLSNSLIYLNSCYGGCDKDLCDVFVNRGVKGLIVNNGSIQQRYGIAMQLTTITAMLETNPETKDYYTLSEALNYCKDNLGNDDGNGVSPYVYYGDNCKLRNDGQISGCVKEVTDKAPIKDIEVRALDEKGTVIEKTKTDKNGNFTLSLPAGKYTLNIGGELGATSDYSYETYTTDVTVDSNVWTVLKEDILLSRATMRIAGNVYDSESKEPLADVEVKAYRVVNGTSEYVSSGTSNANGEYIINISKNGTYNLEFTKSGYTTATQNAVMTFGNLTYAEWQYLIKDNTNGIELGNVGDTIEFGSYPQSRVTDEATLSALNNLPLNWVSYGYYSGNGSYGSMVQSDYMKYVDVIYNGDKYRGVTFSSYRPIYATDLPNYSFQSANGYKINNIYWFKYEPILWKVLNPSKGLLISEIILDSQSYSNAIYFNNENFYKDEMNTIYANNYYESSIRQWLNNDFYNIAFTLSQKDCINVTELDNSAFSNYYEKFNSLTSYDKVFLLSWSDILNINYGFSSYIDYRTGNAGQSGTRIAKGTDYSKCQGLDFDLNYSGNAKWILRSAGRESGCSMVVNEKGEAYNGSGVNRTVYGIRPAICLKTSNK